MQEACAITSCLSSRGADICQILRPGSACTARGQPGRPRPPSAAHTAICMFTNIQIVMQQTRARGRRPGSAWTARARPGQPRPRSAAPRPRRAGSRPATRLLMQQTRASRRRPGSAWTARARPGRPRPRSAAPRPRRAGSRPAMRAASVQGPQGRAGGAAPGPAGTARPPAPACTYWLIGLGLGLRGSRRRRSARICWRSSASSSCMRTTGLCKQHAFLVFSFTPLVCHTTALCKQHACISDTLSVINQSNVQLVCLCSRCSEHLFFKVYMQRSFLNHRGPSRVLT